MDRRIFLKAGAMGLAASAFGCDPEQRKKGGAILEKAAPLVVLLPIPSTHKLVLSLVMRVGGAALQWDALWEDSSGQRTAVHNDYQLTPAQQAQLANRTPVVIQNDRAEDFNDKVMLPEKQAMVLANQTPNFKLGYRCPNVTKNTAALSKAPQFAAELSMLKIPCWIRPVGNGLAEATYGQVAAWQFLYTPLEGQADWWKRLLLGTPGFEATVQSA